MSAAVRLARTEDAGAIARIHVRSWQAAYSGLVPDRHLDAMSVPAYERKWHGGLRWSSPGERTWVVEEEGTVAGFARTGPSRDADLPPGTAELYVIYLDPAAWGRGLGKKLFSHCAADLRAHGQDQLSVWVLDGNRRGRRFYEACGMALDGAQKVEFFHTALVFEVRYRLALRRPAP